MVEIIVKFSNVKAMSETTTLVFRVSKTWLNNSSTY